MDPRMLCVTFTLACGVSASLGDWPTSPNNPLFVGPLNNAFDERAALEGADDGSVWLAWQNNYCVGDVLLQRVTLDGDLLDPDAVAIQEDPTCGFHLPPLLIPIGDSAIASRASSALQTTPIQRFDATGSPLWSPAYTTSGSEYLGEARRLISGDLMIFAGAGWDIHAERLDTSGNRVWANPTLFDSGVGSNYRPLDVIAHPDGGALFFWDAHVTYTKRILAMRLSPDGTLAWGSNVQMTETFPDVTSSRHTRPSIVPDGQGGALVFFAQGFETATTPAPLLMQRINEDGSLAFSLNATRVSLGTDRQFDPIAMFDETTGDAIVVWRDGILSGQTIRAQRIGIDGQRRWGNEGIAIGTIENTLGSFDAIWNEGQLRVVIGGSDGVTVSRFGIDGVQVGTPITVSDESPSSFVKITRSLAGTVVAWQIDVPDTLDDELVAMRVNSMGILGPEPCNSADLLPDAQLNFFDVSAFLSRFSAQDPAADQNGDGTFDFFDVSTFLGAFSTGCP